MVCSPDSRGPRGHERGAPWRTEPLAAGLLFTANNQRSSGVSLDRCTLDRRTLNVVTADTVLLETHEAYFDHDPGRGHPERPARLRAVLQGINASGVRDAIVCIPPREATRQELELIHDAAYLDAVEA